MTYAPTMETTVTRPKGIRRNQTGAMFEYFLRQGVFELLYKDLATGEKKDRTSYVVKGLGLFLIFFLGFCFF